MEVTMLYKSLIEDCIKNELHLSDPFDIVPNKNGGQSITYRIYDSLGNPKWIVKIFDYLKDIRSYLFNDQMNNYNSLNSFLEDIENTGNYPFNIENIVDFIELQKRCFDRYIQVGQIADLQCFPKMIHYKNEIKIDSSFYGMLIETFVFGKTLEERLRFKIDNRATFAYDFLCQLGNHLEELSRHGIIHRDLSPDNIMIIEDTYIMIDPGMVKLEDGTATKSHMILGKKFYASPEQYFGNAKLATYGSDLYAIGIIALEIILGYNPLYKIISEGNVAIPHKELLNKYNRDIEDEIFRSIEENNFTARLVLIIKKLIQTEERLRFDSVNAFIKALKTMERMVHSNE